MDQSSALLGCQPCWSTGSPPCATLAVIRLQTTSRFPKLPNDRSGRHAHLPLPAGCRAMQLSQRIEAPGGWAANRIGTAIANDEPWVVAVPWRLARVRTARLSSAESRAGLGPRTGGPTERLAGGRQHQPSRSSRHRVQRYVGPADVIGGWIASPPPRLSSSVSRPDEVFTSGRGYARFEVGPDDESRTRPDLPCNFGELSPT